MTVKESWEFRSARMKPLHSRMEEEIRLKLAHSPIRPIITDRKFVTESTTPDFFFPKHNVAVYLDGPPHKNKEDRDSCLREKLTKRHGIRVVPISYERFSQKEVERVFKLILEEVR